MTLRGLRPTLTLVPLVLLGAYGIYECTDSIAQVLFHDGGRPGLFRKPAWGMAHYLPAIPFLALLPFQFWGGFRARHPRIHRWMGRGLVTLGVVLAVSGLAFPYAMPQRPVAERVFMTTFFIVFLFFLGQALLSARRGDFVRHREWMIRMAFTIVTPLTQRLIFPLMAATTTISSIDGFWGLFLTAAWFAWGVNIALAEWWLNLRATRPRIRRAASFT